MKTTSNQLKFLYSIINSELKRKSLKAVYDEVLSNYGQVDGRVIFGDFIDTEIEKGNKTIKEEVLATAFF